jgi:hypothetical protein
VSTEAAPEKKEEEKPKSSRAKIPLMTILPPLINTVFVLITLVFLIYTRFIFKRPGIKEPEERKKIEAAQKKQKEEEKKVTYFPLDPITVNIASTPIEGGSPDARKLHYVNLGIAFETHGDRNKEILEQLKPFILDQIIFILGRKTYDQLATAQGRYVLQFQIQEAVNQLAFTKLAAPPHDPPVSHIFFNQLIVQ